VNGDGVKDNVEVNSCGREENNPNGWMCKLGAKNEDKRRARRAQLQRSFFLFVLIVF